MQGYDRTAIGRAVDELRAGPFMRIAWVRPSEWLPKKQPRNAEIGKVASRSHRRVRRPRIIAAEASARRQHLLFRNARPRADRRLSANSERLRGGWPTSKWVEARPEAVKARLPSRQIATLPAETPRGSSVPQPGYSSVALSDANAGCANDRISKGASAKKQSSRFCI